MIEPRTDADGAIAAFRSACGADAVRDGEAVWRCAAAGAVPHCVVEPADASRMAAAVRAAAAHGLAVVATGNGTHLGVGWPPRRYDAALSARRLQRIVAHDAADLTVTVEAGLTLRALNEALADAGQWLPIDPPVGDVMTIGGLIAADRSGPLRHGYGTVRDYLIGIRAVTAAGEVVRGGGQVVKNVAGYDLPKLLTGSYGTLAIIVEASFKIQPRPAALDVFEWKAPTLREALERAHALGRSAVLPVLVEVVNEAAAESLGLGDEAAVLIGCAGSPAHVEEQARRMDMVSAGAATKLSAGRGAALLRALREFSQPADDRAMVARLSARPTALPPLLDEVEAIASAAALVVEVAVHAGAGVAWCQMLGAPSADGLRAAAERMRAAARRHTGWAVFETIPGELRGDIDPWGYEAPALSIMRRVKAALDPNGCFSPGRFVGQI
ncbi:MAG: FAD-binding oxidoreductase [Candidatus Binatia bacterium]